jgi:ABC-2 type transport system permease protein
MTLKGLFKKRNTAYLKDLTKYGRIIINDHFVLILFILFGAGGFAYSNYLETITLGMVQPRLLVAFLFLLVVSTGRVKLLLEPADKIFLLPKEQAFKKIFKQMIRSSYLQSLLSVAILTILTFPIFVTTIDAQTYELFLIFLTLAGLKWLNMLTRIAPFFEMEENNSRLLLTGVKILAIIGLLFINIPITTLLVVALAVYSAYQFFSEKIYFNHLFRWESMIQAEEKRMQQLYRFIGLFTNVPTIETNIKRLPWLDKILETLSKRNPKAPYYYILRTVTRNTEYSLLILRATIVGVLVLAVTGTVFISLVLVLLFLYIIGFQLLPLVNELERLPQFQMYPISAEEKARAVFKLIFQILFLVSILLGLASVNMLGMYGLILIPIGFVFAYLFTSFYAPSRLKTNY